MKLHELSNETNVQTIKVRLSESLYKGSSLPYYDIESKDVYLMGAMMGDFFVKTDLTSDQVYPMFRDSIRWDELKDLEVVEDE